MTRSTDYALGLLRLDHDHRRLAISWTTFPDDFALVRRVLFDIALQALSAKESHTGQSTGKSAADESKAVAAADGSLRELQNLAFALLDEPPAAPASHRVIPGKAAHLMDRDAVKEAMAKPCGCTQKCLDAFSVEDVLSLHTAYAQCGGEDARTAMLLSYIKLQAKAPSAAGSASARFHRPSLTVMQRHVCVSAFCRVIGCSLYKYYQCVDALVASNGTATLPGVHGSALPRLAPVSDSVAGWLRMFFEWRCDRLNDSHWVLPGCPSWQALYDDYWTEMRARNETLASQSSFDAVRKELFQCVKLPNKSTHALCVVCLDLKLFRCSPADSAAALARLQAHRQDVARERALEQREIQQASVLADSLYVTVDYSSGRDVPWWRDGVPAVRVARVPCVVCTPA